MKVANNEADSYAKCDLCGKTIGKADEQEILIIDGICELFFCDYVCDECLRKLVEKKKLEMKESVIEEEKK